MGTNNRGILVNASFIVFGILGIKVKHRNLVFFKQRLRYACWLQMNRLKKNADLIVGSTILCTCM